MFFLASPLRVCRPIRRTHLNIRLTLRRSAAVPALSLLMLGGCLDAPTMPEAIEQIAGGEPWVAVPAPASLPDLESWLPYVDRSEPEPGETAVLARIHALGSEAHSARAHGRLARAAELEREAIRLAVLSLERPIDARVLHGGLQALDGWGDRVEASLDLSLYPGIAGSLELVRSARATAARALESGDTTTAVLELISAAEAIRSHSPSSVALRALGRAEARIHAADSGPTSDRAIHLIRSARLELVSGDPSRALRRALYALQLIEGRHIRGTGDLLHP